MCRGMQGTGMGTGTGIGVGMGIGMEWVSVSLWVSDNIDIGIR